MPSYTHNTAPTQFVEAAGIRFAYRRFGGGRGTPLVLLQHFRGDMDNYPGSNHGSQFQCPQLSVRQVRLFLDEKPVL